MAEPPQLVLVGAGGHARVLIDALRCAGYTGSVAALDSDESRYGTSVLGIEVVGGDAMLETFARSGSRYFAVAVGGTRDNGPRAGLYERATSLGLAAMTIVHPQAVVSQAATVGAGTQILAGAIVNPGARLGCNVIVNTAAVVEHDCDVGDHAHVATGALLASTVTVGTGAHIGIGAVVRQSLTIGAGAVVARGGGRR